MQFSEYCVLASKSLLSEFNKGLDGAVLTTDDMMPGTRASSARRVRLTVDPPSDTFPRIKVYYSEDATDAGLRLSIDIPVPTELRVRQNFTWGFIAGSRGDTDFKGWRGCSTDAAFHHLHCAAAVCLL